MHPHHRHTGHSPGVGITRCCVGTGGAGALLAIANTLLTIGSLQGACICERLQNVATHTNSALSVFREGGADFSECKTSSGRFVKGDCHKSTKRVACSPRVTRWPARSTPATPSRLPRSGHRPHVPHELGVVVIQRVCPGQRHDGPQNARIRARARFAPYVRLAHRERRQLCVTFVGLRQTLKILLAALDKWRRPPSVKSRHGA
jgi:hypothetical protein